MKLRSLYAVISLLFLAHPSKAQKLYGFVYEQNSGKKPITGVLVKSSFANQTTTTTRGSYTLSFQDGRPGKTVLINAEKENWIITDKSRLQVNLPDDPFANPHAVIMCRQDIWNKQVADNRAIIEKEISSAYGEKLATLNKQNKNYQQQVDSLQDQFTKMEKGLNELAEIMSRTNLDEVTAIERKAYQLFREGKIEACIQLRASLESEKNFLKEKTREKQIDSLKQVIDTAKAGTAAAIALHKRNIKEEARLAQIRFDWKTAEEKLEFLAVNDTSDHENIFNYAYFLQSQNQFDKSQHYYEVYLLKIKGLAKSDPAKYDPDIAITQNNLGVLYMDKHDYTAAEAADKGALEIYKGLAKSNPAVYDADVAMAQNNLGNLYSDKHDYTAAEAAYKEALEISKRLAKYNPAVYDPDVANTQSNLGVLYSDKHDYIAAEAAYKEALEISKRLAKSDPTVYDPDVANTQNNLGILYADKNDYGAAEDAFKYTLEIYKGLAKSNPAVYDPYVASTQSNLGNLYRDKHNYSTAEAAYKAALEIYKRLAKSNLAVYDPYVASTQSNLGNLYRDKHDYSTAEAACKEALEIYKRLAKSNPEVYDPDVAMTQNGLGGLYLDKHDYSAAEAACKEALEIRKRLAKSNPAVYDPYVASTQSNLGILYSDRHDYTAAEAAFREALEIYKRLAKSNPAVNDPAIANAQNNLGILYYGKHDYTTAEAAYKAALEIYKRLAKSDSAVYDPDIANTQNNLGILYADKRDYIAAEAAYKEALEIYEKLEKNTAGYIENVISTNLLLYETRLLMANNNAEKLTIQADITNLKRKWSGRYFDNAEVANELGRLSWYLLLNKMYKEAEDTARQALFPDQKDVPEDYDEVVEWINTNLALSLVLQNKYEEAEKIYLRLKDKPYNEAIYKEAFLKDIDDLEKEGITHKDFEKVRALLK